MAADLLTGLPRQSAHLSRCSAVIPLTSTKAGEGGGGYKVGIGHCILFNNAANLCIRKKHVQNKKKLLILFCYFDSVCRRKYRQIADLNEKKKRKFLK
jgi:hypothetical protein